MIRRYKVAGDEFGNDGDRLPFFVYGDALYGMLSSREGHQRQGIEVGLSSVVRQAHHDRPPHQETNEKRARNLYSLLLKSLI